MKNSVILVLFFALPAAFADDPCSNVGVITQATIGGIVGCREIIGDLTIGNITSAQLQLPFLLRLHGSLNIINVNWPGFTNLDGLQSLFHIKGNVSIMETSLVNCRGLGFLNETGIVNINIVRNEKLMDVGAFEGVPHVSGTVTLLDNYAITNLPGFYSLQSIGGSLNIAHMPNLLDVLAFQALTSIGTDLIIVNCPMVQDLEGLRNLQIIGGDIDLETNERLLRIGGFSNIGFGNLHFFQGSITIYNNSHLNDLDTLISPHVNFTQNIIIEDNERLQNVNGFSSVHKDPYLQIMGTVSIIHNRLLESVDPILNAATMIGAMQVNSNPSITNITSYQAGFTKPEVFDMLILANLNLRLITLPSIDQRLQIIDNQALQTIVMCDAHCEVAAGAQVFIYNNGALRCGGVAQTLKNKGAQCIGDAPSGGVMNGGQIAGIVIGCICGMALVVFVAYRAIGAKKAFAETGGRGTYVRHTYQKMDVNQDTE